MIFAGRLTNLPRIYTDRLFCSRARALRSYSVQQNQLRRSHPGYPRALRFRKESQLGQHSTPNLVAVFLSNLGPCRFHPHTNIPVLLRNPDPSRCIDVVISVTKLMVWCGGSEI